MKKLKLNQVIAIVNGEKTRAKKTETEIHRRNEQPALFDGFTRRYEPLDSDNGEKLPDEKKNVQLKVKSCISEMKEALASMFDMVATQDIGNQSARTDLVVDDKVVAANVPATYLIFLEKQLVDISTYLGQLPVLDPSEKWEYSGNSGLYETETSKTIKTKKTIKPITLAEATKEHPAQVQMINEDVLIGHWNTKKLSGAIPSDEKEALLRKVRQLIQAVKLAREEANMTEVEMSTIGTQILEHLLG